jgi:hypothetical protein
MAKGFSMLCSLACYTGSGQKETRKETNPKYHRLHVARWCAGFFSEVPVVRYIQEHLRSGGSHAKWPVAPCESQTTFGPRLRALPRALLNMVFITASKPLHIPFQQYWGDDEQSREGRTQSQSESAL